MNRIAVVHITLLLSLTACAADAARDTASASEGATITSLAGTRWSSVSSGERDLCALTAEGRAWCWNAQSGAPRAVPGDHVFTAISVGSPRSCAVPSQATCGGDEKVHVCALEQDGAAWCWGANQWGQLGDGDSTGHDEPVPVSGGIRFRSVVAGSGFTCGVATDATAYCWGYDGKGDLGTERAGIGPNPIPLPVAHNVRAIAAGVDFACALDGEGKPFCWGDDYRARLGSDAAATSASGRPVPVNGTYRFASLSAGRAHVCGLTNAGSALCWGSNSDGELGGNAQSLESRDPLAVQAPAFSTISAGLAFHTCGIAQNGQAWCWGRDNSGQLGAGDAPHSTCYTDPCRPTPAPVSGNTRFRSLSAGAEYTCGVSEPGELLCWGRAPMRRFYARPARTPARVLTAGSRPGPTGGLRTAYGGAQLAGPEPLRRIP